jgi:hypothetical protein
MGDESHVTSSTRAGVIVDVILNVIKILSRERRGFAV